MQTVPAAFGHLWSLSVEEQFYIFWPIFILLIPRKFTGYFIVLVFLISLCWFLYRYDFLGLPGRMYSLAMGGFIAYVKYINSKRFEEWVKLKLLFAFFVSGIFIYKYISNSVALSLFSFILVYACVINKFPAIVRKFLQNKTISYLGKISYGIYLYHLPLSVLFTYYIFDPIWLNIDFLKLGFQDLKYNSWIIKLPLYSVLTFIVAHFSYKYLEIPFLKLKKNL